MKIKQYKYEKKEVGSKEIELPKETSYYFETGVRRSIKIVPRFTTWNKENFNKDEELYELEVTCLYNSFECRAEKFNIIISRIEEIYYSEKHKYKEFIHALIEGWFDNRTKEQFEADFKCTFDKMQGVS